MVAKISHGHQRPALPFIPETDACNLIQGDMTAKKDRRARGVQHRRKYPPPDQPVWGKVQAEFLVQFAQEALFRAFLRLAPAARQIPQARPGQVRPVITLAGQDGRPAEQRHLGTDEIHRALRLVIDVTVPDLDLTVTHSDRPAQAKPGDDRDDGKNQDQKLQPHRQTKTHKNAGDDGPDGKAKEYVPRRQDLKHTQRKAKDDPGPPGICKVLDRKSVV